ncbi:MAG: hydrogenase [Rhodospirillales bacterium 69-11]|nr:cytochrome b/b6 domain-containing protein [Rhodospirillales bacterium]OJW25639.1 MAG: hydrogenase [Rhodospirillales bacterium 69-11]
MRQLYLPMRVWDAPTRLFHWLIVVLLGTSWATVEYGYMEWHKLSGYTILTLLLFRIVWGFVGSDTARFSRFLRSPIAAIRHLLHMTKREEDREIGHNAAGGWMVLGLLLLLLAQVVTGLMSNDDISVEGPYARLVGKDWSDWATGVHSIIFTIIQITVVLHILAVLAYLGLKGQNLVRPMITGKKRLPGNMRAPRMASPALALLILALSAGVVTALVRFAP